MYEIKLPHAILSQANLQDAYLRLANLQDAHLGGANLQEAHLGGANLQEADLWLANLQEAELWKANLQKAHLVGANLQEAKLWAANLQGVFLMNAKNLTNSQIKSACFWITGKYKGSWDYIHGGGWIVDQEANQKYIEKLKQDKSSDPKREPDCSEWKQN